MPGAAVARTGAAVADVGLFLEASVEFISGNTKAGLIDLGFLLGGQALGAGFRKIIPKSTFRGSKNSYEVMKTNTTIVTPIVGQKAYDYTK